MSLFVASLNSGSNGNCYYIGNQDEAILIDAGLSCRETEQRLKRLELSMKKIKGIFVSHEHSDHIYGVSSLSKRNKLPVYITEKTMIQGRLRLKEELTVAFKPYEPTAIGGITVTAFPTFHDASDPHNFMVSFNSVNVGVFTDIGRASEDVTRHFEQCHAAFLESNYDEDLLESGSYPVSLKDRIRGGKGHLSNTQAMELFLNHRPPFMSHLFLSHLSENNNSPKLVKNLFSGVAGKTEIVIASRKKETQLFHIRNRPGFSNLAPPRPAELQLSLFGQ
jgi:phosphoribosyl 1,2-cyclic phosphodiesterase